MNWFITVLTSSSISVIFVGLIFLLLRTYFVEKIKKSVEHDYATKLEETKAALKDANDRRLEQLKIELQTDFERYRTLYARYSEHQFKMYNDLWASLCDLKKVADKLWENSTRENLSVFDSQLEIAKEQLNKNALLIESRHFNEMNVILHEFNQYQVGKETLINLRDGKFVWDKEGEEPDYESVIAFNKYKLQKLEEYLPQMKECLRSQVRPRV
jgi:hypothetical protein